VWISRVSRDGDEGTFHNIFYLPIHGMVRRRIINTQKSRHTSGQNDKLFFRFYRRGEKCGIGIILVIFWLKKDFVKDFDFLELFKKK
jgi:hypothetical protein